jgi:RNA-directed DNA polymerase
MRVVQFKILKTILEKVDIPDYIYAFEKGKNIPSMAEIHVGKKIVVSLDLKDFFTSIKQNHLQQVYGHLGFGEDAARTLSELCTYKAFVPQGALTSPKLSNLFTSLTFGPLIKEFCDSKGYTLSIYADDITISRDTEFQGEEGKEATRKLIEFVTDTVSRFSMRVNREKTKVMHAYQRQWVCGTVVNEKLNLLKKDRYSLKAIVHNCELNGIQKEAFKTGIAPGEFAAKVAGKIGWFAQLNPVAGNRLKEKFKTVYDNTTDFTPLVEGGEKASEVTVVEKPELPW